MTLSLRSAWTVALPVIGLVAVALTWQRELHWAVAAVVGLVLIGSVLAAVHHAEIVAARVGEPFGSLILAVAVTVIEVGLILTLMLSGKGDTSALARDTVFAAVMITCNGIVGLTLLLAGRDGPPRFNPEGTGAALGVVATLATLTLVLPSFTTTASGPVFSPGQLAFAAIASAALYLVFVTSQTRKHRDFFLPVTDQGDTIDEDAHADRPTTRAAVISLGILAVALFAVVFLAKSVSPSIEGAVVQVGIPHSFVGVIIALLVLLPEGIAASKAALRNRMQTSLNLAYGSAIASIGLTIPAIAVASIWIDGELALGLGGTQIVLLLLTVVVGILTVTPGRATRIQGSLHLIVFAAFVFLAISP
jgi:Ca2+:H+ antiporter